MLKNPQTLRSYPKAQITQGADRVSAPTRRSPTSRTNSYGQKKRGRLHPMGFP